MRNKNYGLYAIAIAVGALAFGVSASSFGVLGFVLICPLMMFFMMRGMGGMGGGHDQDQSDASNDRDHGRHDDSMHKS